LTPDPHVPRNLSRALRAAHNPQKILEIPLTVAEKIEFEKKFFGAPWRPNRKCSGSRDHMFGKLSLGTKTPENMKTLGLEMTTLFEFFDIALGPLMGCQEKFCYIRTCKSTTTESYSINSSTLGVIGVAESATKRRLANRK